MLALANMVESRNPATLCPFLTSGAQEEGPNYQSRNKSGMVKLGDDASALQAAADQNMRCSRKHGFAWATRDWTRTASYVAQTWVHGGCGGLSQCRASSGQSACRKALPRNSRYRDSPAEIMRLWWGQATMLSSERGSISLFCKARCHGR